MPNTREKLTEMQMVLCRSLYTEYDEAQRAPVIDLLKTAENLIANGVTVQEWISVKDRLPEDDSDVLAYMRTGEESRIYPANYANGMWFDCIFNTPATDTTTHWMPLPQPPMGNKPDQQQKKRKLFEGN